MYTDSHYYSKAIKHNNYGFVANDMDPIITIYLVWGLRERDLSSCHFSDVECTGAQRFDNSFDASTEAAQQAFVVSIIASYFVFCCCFLFVCFLHLFLVFRVFFFFLFSSSSFS